MADQFEDHNEDHNQEGWQDTQPPVDTFHDADMNAEGMATVSEESGDHEEYEKSESAEGGAVKKPSKLIPLAAGGGLLLVLAAVLLMHFSGGSSQPTTVTAQTSPVRPPIVPPPSDPNSTITLTDDGKLKIPDQATAPLSDSSPANVATNTTAVGGATTPSTADSPSAIMPNPSPLPAEAPPLMAPTPVQNAAAPVSSPEPQPLQPRPVPQTVSAQGGSLQPTQATNTGHNADVDALSTHVADLQRSLDQVTQQLAQVSSMMANQANQAANNAAANPEMEERLNKIEQHLVQIEHSPSPSLASPPTATNDVMGNPTVGLAKPDITSDVSPKSSSRASRHAHAATSHHTVRTVSHRAPSHKKSRPSDDMQYVSAASSSGVLEYPHGGDATSGWILRAATPNEAWVAKNASSSDLTHVRLGEELPGVGQVQSIRPVGDSWVIEGTEGVVR